MVRDIFTNKWVVGSFGFLIVFDIACYSLSWYQQELAPYEQQTAETREQLEASHNNDKDSKVERELAANATDENIKLTAEKHKAETVSTADVKMSPFGFGAYPEIPQDFPEQRIFNIPHGSVEGELLDRVRVKLWKEGVRPDGIGHLQSTGLIYPTVRGTVYVRWGEFRGKKYITRLRCHPADSFDITKFRFENEIPSDLKVLDFSEGINPYEYLDLPKEGNE